MKDHKFTSFHVKRYRSLLDVKIDFVDNSPVVICGENNIGKTNFLRALNVFFNHPFQDDIFKPADDIPHHIYHGSQGAGAKTELVGTFEKKGKKALSLKVTFFNDGTITYHIGGKHVEDESAVAMLSSYQFLYVESHNIDLPKLISVVLEKDGLLPLDAKRTKQSRPLSKLAEFIELSQAAISDIERSINQCFEKLTDFDGILNGKEIRIKFIEFEKLRDIVKTMTEITLYDGNNHGIASKGSGAQRAVFLSLMQFISQNSKKNIIWGVDEPEAFLQPRLQKKVSHVLNEIVSKQEQPVILTTHSQHFVNLSNLKSTHIFVGTVEERKYLRKPDKVFYEINTKPQKCASDFEKAQSIKTHLGISNNDGWELMPFNIIVEGEEDKKYLITLLSALNFPVPNIVWSGGAAKFAGYLQYYNNFAEDLSYKPEFLCLFDNDTEGREQGNKIKTYKHIKVTKVDLPRYDGVLPTGNSNEDWEMEDFLPPEVVVPAINSILRKEQYKIITAAQIKQRTRPAHKGKQLLKYCEECAATNNPDKPPVVLDEQGRKMQICAKFCSQVDKAVLASNLTAEQIKFLSSLSK